MPSHDFPAEGRYDPRRGAAAYAPNIALFGSLSAPAIILLFQTPAGDERFPSSLRSLAVGLLVIGLIGSLVGSFALAAIGAEADPTANLAPAIMYAAVSVVTSLLSVVGAFEVLVAVFLPASVTLFIVLIGGASVFGVLATTFAIADSTDLGPRDPVVKARWLNYAGVWLQNRQQAYAVFWKFALGGVIPIAAALIIRLADPSVVPSRSQTVTTVISSAGIALALLGSFLSLNRTAHPTRGEPQRAMKPLEAVVTTAAVAGIAAILLLLLPASG